MCKMVEKLIVSLSIKRKRRFPLLYTVASEKWAEREIAILAGGKVRSICLFLDFAEKSNGNMKSKRCQGVNMYFEGVEVEISDFFGWLRKTSIN